MKNIELLDAIDPNNNVIGQVTKEEAYRNKISHRIVHVMVISNGKVFIPRRSMKVRYLPGYYCTSAGGHVRAGETSLQGALRELEEEIGLAGPVELVKDFFYEHEFRVHTSLYIKRYHPAYDRIRLDPEEVMSGEFLSLEEIKKLNPREFHPQLQSCIQEIEELL